MHTENVRTIRLDDEVRNRKHATLLIKLDVEGAECLALQGMREVAGSKSRIALFCEVNPSAHAAAEKLPMEMIRWSHHLGLAVYRIAEDQRKLIPVQDKWKEKRTSVAYSDGNSNHNLSPSVSANRFLSRLRGI